MPKYPTKTRTRDSETAARVKRTAKLVGVSKRMVYMVIQGDRKNEEVMTVYMRLKEMDAYADDLTAKTSLIKHIEAAVPFN